MKLGDLFPNFEAQTTNGSIMFHDWLGDSWGILFSHPADYTPVCTTELGRVAQLYPEFEKRGVKIIALSCNSVDSHQGWIKDIQSYANIEAFPYPIIDDESRNLAELLGMIDPEEKSKEGLPVTCRAVFVIGPDKKLKLSLLYPATTGRSFDELLRAVDSLQLTASKRVATPVDWKQGDRCMVLPTVGEDEVSSLFPNGDVEVHDVPSGKKYLRSVNQPK